MAEKQLSPALGDALGQSVPGHGCKTNPVYQNPSKEVMLPGEITFQVILQPRDSHQRATVKLEQTLLGHKQLHSRAALPSPYQSQQISTNITFKPEPSLGKQPRGDLRGRRQDEERLTQTLLPKPRQAALHNHAVEMTFVCPMLQETLFSCQLLLFPYKEGFYKH